MFDNSIEQTTIVHHLLEYGGILQPFFEISDIQLEHRDPQGRTLLLASYRSRFGTTDPATLNISNQELFRNGALRENLKEKQAEERATHFHSTADTGL